MTHASGENTRALYFQSASRDAYEVRVTGRVLETDGMIMRVPVGLYMLIR